MSKLVEIDDSIFKGMRLGEIKSYVKLNYETKLKGKTIVNKDKGVSIVLGREGLHHVLFARKIGYVKIKALIAIDKMIENSTFSNFKNPDDDDPKEVLGYLHFKSKVIVEGSVQIFRITVRLTIDGKFFYDHAVWVKK